MSVECKTIPFPTTGQLPVWGLLLRRFDGSRASQLASLAALLPSYAVPTASTIGFSSNPISFAFRSSPFTVRSRYDAS
jgi:hypothetical protein